MMMIIYRRRYNYNYNVNG